MSAKRNLMKTDPNAIVLLKSDMLVDRGQPNMSIC
jgi:hypothetical protein